MQEQPQGYQEQDLLVCNHFSTSQSDVHAPKEGANPKEWRSELKELIYQQRHSLQRPSLMLHSSLRRSPFSNAIPGKILALLQSRLLVVRSHWQKRV